ncbi:MAG: hypothetical protein ACREFQ_09080 [Stellaceae bacterium]
METIAKLLPRHSIFSRCSASESDMADYRCYFLDAQGAIRSVREIESVSDSDAVNMARDAFAQQRHFRGFELWQRNRRVHLELEPRTETPDKL